MDNWLKLGALPAQGGPTPEPDLQFEVVVSPYDVPEAVRGVKRPGGRLRIEFRYIDGLEPGHEIKLDEHISVTEGKHSKRLLAVEVDVDAMGATSVGFAINAPVVDTLRSRLHSAWRQLANMQRQEPGNSDRVRRVLEASEAELLSSMATP